MGASWIRAIAELFGRMRGSLTNKAGPLVSANLPVAKNSDALRAHFAAHGVAIPELRTVVVLPDVAVCGFEVHSADPLPTWQRLRAATDSTGYYPLIFQSPFGGSLCRAAPMRDTLEAANRVDAAHWIARQLTIMAKYVRDSGRTSSDSTASRRAKTLDLVTTSILDMNFFVLLLPTRDGCEFPACLDWCDPAGYATPAEQVALLRSWRDRFGAEPAVLVMDNTLELVGDRVMTLETRKQFVREMTAYCPDTIAENDVSETASWLESPPWHCYFWWD